MPGTKISAANEDRVRNNPINAVQIRLQASFIGQKDCVILSQLSARLSLRQGQAAAPREHSDILKPCNRTTAATAAFSDPQEELSSCRGHLRNEASEGLVRLLGKITVECANLLRLSDEGLVSRLREFGLNFNRLVERLHARELLNIGLRVFKRLLCVIAVSGCYRLKAA